MSDYISHDHEHDGIDRRGFLQCMAWAGTGLLWTISGGVLGADQKITRKEALQVETINNAYLTFEERLKGSIETGKLADLVVLPEDILACPDKHIEQMRVSMTMVGGTVVYRRP